MLRLVLIFAAAIASQAFSSSGMLAPSRLGSTAYRSPLNLQMGKTQTQKKVIVQTVSERLKNAALIFSIKLEKVTMPEIDRLRDSLPEGTNAVVIKNRLLKIASAGSPWAASKSLSKGSNLWIIVDSDIKGTFKAYKEWQKASKKEDGIIGGVIEGNAYDGANMEAISELPSKSELYAKMAGAIKAVPGKLAGTIKEIPTKTARAIKLATTKDA